MDNFRALMSRVFMKTLRATIVIKFWHLYTVVMLLGFFVVCYIFTFSIGNIVIVKKLDVEILTNLHVSRSQGVQKSVFFRQGLGFFKLTQPLSKCIRHVCYIT